MSTFRIGSRQFSSADEARYFIRSLLAKYPIGTEVGENDDLEFLRELLKRHPQYDELCRAGIIRLKVTRNRKRKATELEVATRDGTTAVLGWLECLPEGTAVPT